MEADAVNLALQAISTVGFPIVCCGVMFFLVYKFLGSISTTLTKVNDSNEELRKSIEELTDAVRGLQSRVGDGE